KTAKRAITILSLLVVFGMVLAGCGTSGVATQVSEGATVVATDVTGAATSVSGAVNPTDTASTSAPASGDVVKIAVDLPASGADATDGIPTRNGMQLAIDEANAKGGVTLDGKQYKIQMYFLDDVPPGGQAHDPAQGSKNADSFIGDKDVMVMLGPFNSNVARAMMPKLNTAGLCNISPSNTGEGLTKPEFGETKTLRPTGIVTYFRVCTTDDIQGPAGADYAYDKLGARKAYILDDTESYGKGLADNFQKEFAAKGGTVLGHDGVPKGTTDYSSILSKIASTNPDILFYGGTASNNIPLARKQMKAAGLNIPLMGGDGIQDAEYLKVAGADAEGSYSTVAAVNVNTLPEAKQFIADYKAKYNAEPGAYSGPGYEAANIAIDAMKRAGTKNRAAVCQALRNTKNYMGILGETSFDQNGDTDNKVISFYKATGGAWTFVDQLRFGAKP
ncbi:MAG: branched-chain amino acid ABC transporter substrate-binding protein, partial [Chloroflexi bacterium]|nr:branched-chain amino acid ABC transporter substrate-binding protein [Chloroflexota bacterium]